MLLKNPRLRVLEKHIRLAFVRERWKESYSQTGRPSIAPEFLLGIRWIGYLDGITRERRKLVEELRMHRAWRWFTGLGFEQEIPHHCTPRFPRIGTDDSRNRSCSGSRLRRSWHAAWKPDG